MNTCILLLTEWCWCVFKIFSHTPTYVVFLCLSSLALFLLSFHRKIGRTVVWYVSNWTWMYSERTHTHRNTHTSTRTGRRTDGWTDWRNGPKDTKFRNVCWNAFMFRRSLFAFHSVTTFLCVYLRMRSKDEHNLCILPRNLHCALNVGSPGKIECFEKKQHLLRDFVKPSA